MSKSFLWLCALLVSVPVHADRISRMNQTELCTYTAQLKVAAYYFFEQGKPREEVSIKWHGDETQNEIEFVNRTVEEAYAWLAKWKENNTELLSAQSFGDRVYLACMTQKDS